MLSHRATKYVTLTSFVLLTFFISVLEVHAGTVDVTPNPVPQGTMATVIGSGFPNSLGVTVEILSGSCSGPTVIGPLFTSTDGTGSFAVPFSTSTLSVGSYCASAQIGSGPIVPTVLVPFNVVPQTSTTTISIIPEYPFGLVSLLFLMTLLYCIFTKGKGDR